MASGFYAPDTIDGVLELCARFGEDAWLLGGGTELNALGSPGRSGQMISLHRLGLGSIAAAGEEVVIGACCTLQELVEAAEVPEPVRAACRSVRNRTIRNQATIGGQIAAAQRYASVLPMLVALEARVDVVTDSGSTETIPVVQRIAAGRRQLITAVRIRRLAENLRAASAEHRRSTNDLAMLTVAVALRAAGETVDDPAVVVGGVVEHAMRLPTVERRLCGSPLPPRATIEAAVDEALPELTDEPRASARFKRYLAGALVADALAQAVRGRVEVAS